MKQSIKEIIFKIVIALTPKIIASKFGDVGITTIIRHKNTDMLIFSIKSFFYYSQLNLPVNVIDDGTLTSKDVKKIKSNIQNVIVRKRKDNDKKIIKFIKNYKFCLKYRSEMYQEKFYVKLFDPIILPRFSKTIYMDCDILFLNKPSEIISWTRSRKIYGLYATEYRFDKNTPFGPSYEWKIIEKMFAEAISPKSPQGFNSGLLCLNNSSYDLKRIDSILEYIYKVGLEESWTPEQYSFGVLFTEMKSRNLKEKYIHITQGELKLKKDPFSYTCIHFAFNAKHNYFDIAFKLALRTFFFRKKLSTYPNSVVPARKNV